MKIDRWIIEHIQSVWSKSPREIQEAIADIKIPYQGRLQKALKAALIETWRTGQEDAATVLERAKRRHLKQWQKRTSAAVHELTADMDRYAYISKEYETWAVSLGDEVWEKKIRAISNTTSQGLRDGWGLRDQYGYRDSGGTRVSAFEAHGGRGPQFVKPGYTRVIENPGILDQLGPQLADHRGYQLERIARTETTRAYNSGMRSIYDEDDTIVGYEFIAISDTRTTDICLMMNGTTFAKDDPRVYDFTPPLHVNCRSVLSPVFVWDDVEMSVDREKTIKLEDKEGKPYKLTYSPNRIRPMEGLGGKLSPAGFGRSNLMSAAQAAARRGGFVPKTSAESIANFLHPGSAQKAVRVASRTRIQGDLPATRKEANEWWADDEVANAEAIRMYEPDLKDLEMYVKAMQLEGQVAQEMLARTGITREQIYKKVAEARRKIMITPQTRDKWLTGGIRPVYKAERRRVHNQIIDDVIKKGQVAAKGKNPDLLMTGGFPGSGKSAILNHPEYKGWKNKYVHIDSDEIKKMLAKADGIEKLTWQAGTYQLEADDIITRVFARARSERRHILFDGTMKNRKKVVKIIDGFLRGGYKIEVAYSDLPLEKTMIRAMERFAMGGRFVDPAYIATHNARNIKTLEAIKDKVHAWKHWSTDVKFGELAELVGQG